MCGLRSVESQKAVFVVVESQGCDSCRGRISGMQFLSNLRDAILRVTEAERGVTCANEWSSLFPPVVLQDCLSPVYVVPQFVGIPVF